MRRRAPLLALLAAVLALAGLMPAGAQERDDGPDVELSTDAVLVNVVVLAGDDFVRGLSAADFVVKEDGVPQTIDFFGAEKTPFAAAILIDTSGSMEQKLRLARVAAARFMDRTRPQDRVAVYLFGSEVRRLQEFLPGGRDMSDDLWDSKAKGFTKMYDSVLQAATALAERPELRRAILLISDGADTGSAASYDRALKGAQAAGATIYSVDITPMGVRPAGGLDDLRARSALQGLAEKSGGQLFVSRGGSDLNAAFDRIVEEIGNLYTLSYTPTNLKRDGKWRAIEVVPTRPGVRLRARPGYTAPSA